MEQKDMYTLEELYDNLPIALSELGRRGDINEVTLARIRDGYAARRSTINKLLDAFSKVYGIKLTLNNVSGIFIRDKKALQSQQSITEKDEKAPVLAPVVQPRPPVTSPQKRAYKTRDTALPDGCSLASKFAETHGVKRPTFIDHMTKGLGPERERIPYCERDKPNRPNEKERYLTSDQQCLALEFWKRHNVNFQPCNRFDCWCHTALAGSEPHT